MAVTEHDVIPFPQHLEPGFEVRRLAAGRGIVFGLAIVLPFYAVAAVVALLTLH